MGGWLVLGELVGWLGESLKWKAQAHWGMESQKRTGPEKLRSTRRGASTEQAWSRLGGLGWGVVGWAGETMISCRRIKIGCGSDRGLEHLTGTRASTFSSRSHRAGEIDRAEEMDGQTCGEIGFRPSENPEYTCARERL